MKILYNQNSQGGVLSRLGFAQCFVKYITQARDGKYTLKKPHYHTGFEVHIFQKGGAAYEIGEQTVFVTAGDMLIIPPRLVHSSKSDSHDLEKCTFTFLIEKDSVVSDDLDKLSEYKLLKTPSDIEQTMQLLLRDGTDLGEFVNEARIFECIASVVNHYLTAKRKAPSFDESDEDARLAIAKQYIKDNINRAPTVDEVATFCRVSSKQLARIFMAGEGVSVGEYIRLRRCEQAERLLIEDEGSLAHISELMSFNNEYYFNAFFKKHSGMSPGAYRKSFKK